MQRQKPIADAVWNIQFDRNDIERRRFVLGQYLNSTECKNVKDEIERRFPGTKPRRSNVSNACSNTERAYRGDQRDYKAYFEERGADYLAPPWELWEQYFRTLSRRNNQNKKKSERLRHRSVVRKSYAIGNLFFQHGLPSPTRTFRHKNLLIELGKAETRPPRRAKPLLGEPLHKLLGYYDTTTVRGQRDKTISMLGGDHGWRASTIVSIKIEDIDSGPEGVTLGVCDQKTSITGQLQYIPIPHNDGHLTCLACTLDNFLKTLRDMGITEGPLFSGIDRWKNISRKALNPRSITYLLQKNLAAAQIDQPTTYTSHSYRHGVVKACVIARWPQEEIMLRTLHRSRRGLGEYIKGIDPWYFATTRSPLMVRMPVSQDPNRGWKHDK